MLELFLCYLYSVSFMLSLTYEYIYKSKAKLMHFKANINP